MSASIQNSRARYLEYALKPANFRFSSGLHSNQPKEIMRKKYSVLLPTCKWTNINNRTVRLAKISWYWTQAQNQQLNKLITNSLILCKPTANTYSAGTLIRSQCEIEHRHNLPEQIKWNQANSHVDRFHKEITTRLGSKVYFGGTSRWSECLITGLLGVA